MKEALSETVVRLVREIGGVKISELAAAMTDYAAHQGSDVETEQIIDAITVAIKAGDIIEIAYVLPNLESRVELFLLPKGTKIVQEKTYEQVTLGEEPKLQ